MMLLSEKKYFPAFITVFLFAAVSWLTSIFPGHTFDKFCWASWAEHIKHFGLINAYGSEFENNYPPLLQYIIQLYVYPQNSFEAVHANIYQLRIATLFFDFLGIWYIYKWIDGRVRYIYILILCLLNLGFSFNTVIWGQFDGIVAALSFIALYYAHKKNMMASAAFLVLALNMKLQAIVFIPIWGVLWLYNLIEYKKWQTIVYPVIAGVSIQAVILLPFFYKDGGLKQVWNIVTTAVGYYPKVSMNGHNLWYLLYKAPNDIPDSNILLWGFTYKQIALFLFFTSSFIIMLPMLILLVKKVSDNRIWIPKDLLWLICSLIAMLFFFLNTQMHERYIHPVMIFLTAYTLYSHHWVAYAIVSVAYVFSLEIVMVGFEIDPRMPAVMYLITIILLCISWARLWLKIKVRTDADTTEYRPEMGWNMPSS